MNNPFCNRREFFQTGTAALTSALALHAEPARFRHRGYLGWITDLASQPDPHASWPSMRLDAALLEEYRRTFRLMRHLGYNEIVIWGFYVSRYWPADIASAVTRERGALVEKLIDAAHNEGLRVYTGLGVYSWGFEQIIKAYPRVSRGNPRAMCGSLPEAWEWMQKVTDFVFTRFPIDGTSLQSADQGRCDCDQCRVYRDTEYHARLDIRVAEYIRSRWPGKTLAVSGWGMKLDDPAALPALVRLSRNIDYLIDVPDSASRRDPAYRQKLIGQLSCAFGTVGGPQVEPPQHWQRDRWFLPTARAQGEHLARLHQDGGRACEYFFHIMANPGDELSFYVAGKALADPATSWQKHLAASIEELYGTTNQSTVQSLAELFVRAENAYLQYLPTMRSGTLAMEPLESDQPGPPVYITRHLNPEQRALYHAALESLAADFRKIASAVPDKSRIPTILRCLANAQKDVAESG